MSPFHEPTLKIVKERSGGRSELSGRKDRPLHVMHINHKRGPDYEDPIGAVRCTIVEHLAYHLMHIGKANELGLKECQNDWAIDQLNKGSVDFMASIGELEDLQDEINEAMSMWEYFFQMDEAFDIDDDQ